MRFDADASRPFHDTRLLPPSAQRGNGTRYQAHELIPRFLVEPRISLGKEILINETISVILRHLEPFIGQPIIGSISKSKARN